MELSWIEAWDKETHSLPNITTERYNISEYLVGMNFCGSFFFDQSIFEHEDEDFIGSRAGIESTAVVYMPMFCNDIAECSSE